MVLITIVNGVINHLITEGAPPCRNLLESLSRTRSAEVLSEMRLIRAQVYAETARKLLSGAGGAIKIILSPSCTTILESLCDEFTFSNNSQEIHRTKWTFIAGKIIELEMGDFPSNHVWFPECNIHFQNQGGNDGNWYRTCPASLFDSPKENHWARVRAPKISYRNPQKDAEHCESRLV